VTRSLSVLLPVHNVQSSLTRSVHEILDVLAELTGRFELVIVDEGSTDGTWDVARELAQLYPQIRLLRHEVESLRSKIRRGGDSNRVSAFGSEAPSGSEPQGRREARSERRDQVRAAHGDVVIAHDGRSPIDAQEIVRLWRSLSATPAPKFLGMPGSASAARTRLSGRAHSQGFRLIRAIHEEPRRSVAAFGVR
jgi:glycosyltransferase involved in cell wall biosynthesis